MKKTIVSTLFFALVSSAFAGPAAESGRLSKQLAELTGTKEMFVAYLQQCSAPNSGYDPKHIFKSNPSFFGGISPQSAYWPEVEVLFREYQRRMCKYVTAEDFALFYADHYVESLSAEELKAAVAFFSSPTGKKFSFANQGANAEFQKYAQGKMGELYKSTYAELNIKLLDIANKYQREPK